MVAHSYFRPYIKAKIIPANKRKVFYTSMDWEVYPESIYEMIYKYSVYKDIKKIIITENGAAFPDEILDGEIYDKQRIHYINSYLEQVLRSKSISSKIFGYFIWSLTDNFEWAEGYQKRFGLIHIDYDTKKRTIKSSGLWYKGFLENN